MRVCVRACACFIVERPRFSDQSPHLRRPRRPAVPRRPAPRHYARVCTPACIAVECHRVGLPHQEDPPAAPGLPPSPKQRALCQRVDELRLAARSSFLAVVLLIVLIRVVSLVHAVGQLHRGRELGRTPRLRPLSRQLLLVQLLASDLVAAAGLGALLPLDTLLLLLLLLLRLGGGRLGRARCRCSQRASRRLLSIVAAAAAAVVVALVAQHQGNHHGAQRHHGRRLPQQRAEQALFQAAAHNRTAGGQQPRHAARHVLRQACHSPCGKIGTSGVCGPWPSCHAAMGGEGLPERVQRQRRTSHWCTARSCSLTVLPAGRDPCDLCGEDTRRAKKLKAARCPR